MSTRPVSSWSNCTPEERPGQRADTHEGTGGVPKGMLQHSGELLRRKRLSRWL